MSDTQKNQDDKHISARNKLHNAMWKVRDILAAAGLWKTPDTKTAFPYAVTEMGEVFDAHLRALRPDDNRNSDREVDFEQELADLWIMLATAYGRSLQRDGSVADGGEMALVNLNHQIAVAYRHFAQGEDYHLFTGTALIMVEQLCPELARRVAAKLIYISERAARKKISGYFDMSSSGREDALRSDDVAKANIREVLLPFWRTDGEKEI